MQCWNWERTEPTCHSDKKQDSGDTAGATGHCVVLRVFSGLWWRVEKNSIFGVRNWIWLYFFRFPYLVGKFGSDFGLTTEMCFPYSSGVIPTPTPCQNKCAEPALTMVDNYYYVGGYYGACNTVWDRERQTKEWEERGREREKECVLRTVRARWVSESNELREGWVSWSDLLHGVMRVSECVCT